MIEKNEIADDESVDAASDKRETIVDSRFRLIVVAGLRSKQLQRGSLPRIEADPRKRRNTSIALEEVRQGLVHFTNFVKDPKGTGGGA